MFADRLFNIPYTDYWLPLLIGMGIGALAMTVLHWTALRKKTGHEPLPEPASKKVEYDPFMQGSVSEQRRAPRRGGNPVEVFCANPDDKRNPIHAWVRDRSTGGLALLVGTEIAPGTLLSILPVNAPEMTPWVDIEVRACRLLGDHEWELGCQFIRTPPWSILLLFG